VEKVTMPGKKNVFRLYSNDGHALIDLMQLPDEPPPEVNKRVLCRHPFQVQFLSQILRGHPGVNVLGKDFCFWRFSSILCGKMDFF
jgi:hypothetical protein